MSQQLARYVAFADRDADAWGAVWADGKGCFAAAGSFDSAEALDAASLDGSGSADAWHVMGGGLDLTIEPRGEAVSDPNLPGFTQLCQLRGSIAIRHEGHQPKPKEAPPDLDALAIRSARPLPGLDELDSIRELAALVKPANGIALTAWRPRSADGHESDQLAATLFEPDSVQPVAEPRLSTTYGADGAVMSANLELWLEQPEDAEQLYPRRAAASAAGAAVHGATERLAFTVAPLTCLTSGSEGSAVYLMARTI